MRSLTGIPVFERPTGAIHYCYNPSTRCRQTSPVAWSYLGRAPTTLSKFTRRRRGPICSLSDHFSQAGGRMSFGRGNMDLLQVDTNLKSKQDYEAAAILDRTHRDHLWNEWIDYFREVEFVENEIETLEEELQEHIMAEHYSDASEAKGVIQELKSQDVITLIHQELEEAVAKERFDDAARLRDEGLVGLTGWWVARGPDDPEGKLVFIFKEFCRYSGRLFTARDLGLLCGVYDTFGMESFSMDQDDAVEPTGSLAMEVFLKRSQDGKVNHQGCVIRSPGLNIEEVEEDDDDMRPEVNVQTERTDSGKMVTLTVNIIQKDDDSDLVTEIDEMDELDPERQEIIFSADGSEEFYDSDSEVESLIEELDFQFRMPADIKWWDRNRFVLSVDEEVGRGGEERDSKASKKQKRSHLLEEIITATVRALEKEKIAEFPEISEMEQMIISKSFGDMQGMHDEATNMMSLEDQSEITGLLHQSLMASIPGGDNLEGEVMFTRLPVEECSADPFSGYFMGSFGPHGPELLHLSRHKDRSVGKEVLQVRKITGDRSVPAGEILFRVPIDRSRRQLPDVMYAEEMGIRAKYNGEGRYAKDDLTWVPGELLIFDPTSPIAGGAELGLVWNIPKTRRLHILLHRVALPDTI